MFLWSSLFLGLNNFDDGPGTKGGEYNIVVIVLLNMSSLKYLLEIEILNKDGKVIIEFIIFFYCGVYFEM